ncbi:peptide methionine sulfoxide reductase MsrA 2 [Stappia taiwanensis]|nr:peptide-methionine (S)-S-oxide reductase MsrA [Stappia taiwanensis]GGE90858.1 peptide methionine sulfoxide reductase MsrA 2 [Stappia taiwanensis]
MSRLATLLLLPLLLVSGAPARAQTTETAIFAGGCFWCVESDFDRIPGVLETVSGYTGGSLANPTYEQVSAGGTGHYEAVRIRFDPARVSYEALLSAFFRSVDPLDADGQFCDRGASYRTAIFVAGPEQKAKADAAKAKAAAVLGSRLATPILPAAPFYPAEDYHQNYYDKNPVRYAYYRWSCGRDARINAVWGKDAFAGIPGKH